MSRIVNHSRSEGLAYAQERRYCSLVCLRRRWLKATSFDKKLEIDAKVFIAIQNRAQAFSDIVQEFDGSQLWQYYEIKIRLRLEEGT